MTSTTVIITGGLGNQMFQYAMVLALRYRGYTVRLDTSYYDFFQIHNGYELERVFGIRENMTSRKGLHMLWLRLLNKTKPKFLYYFDTFSYDDNIITSPKKYLFGYWQNERYFLDIKSIVRKTFVFKDIDEFNHSLSKDMHSCNSVSMHIRRGDYEKFGIQTLGVNYYKNAVKYILSKVESPFFYIFSDDMEESEKLALDLKINFKLISHNRGINSYKDMYLMSQCKHHILANSSFSWWGAWLNDSALHIVIAPKVWVHNMPKLKPQVETWILF